MSKFLLIAVVAIFLAGVIFAGCSESAYLSGCAECKFDNVSKKFERSCTEAKKAGGVACLSGSYPVAMANYQKGNCSMVDECIGDLNRCTASVASGNEKADCEEGSMATCYATADICFKSAAGKCSNLEAPKCGAPAGLAIISGGAALWAAFLGKKALVPSPMRR